MKTAPLTALFVILLATTTIQSQPDTRKPSGTKTETAEAKKDDAEIRRWMDRWIKACRDHDVDAVMALYAPGVIAYDLVPPLQYVGKDAYRQDFREFFDMFT